MGSLFFIDGKIRLAATVDIDSGFDDYRILVNFVSKNGGLKMKVMLLGTYTAAALKGLMDGSDRRAAVDAMLGKVGGVGSGSIFHQR